MEEGQTVAQIHTCRDTKASPKSNPSNTKQTVENSPSRESGASSAVPAYSPGEENELFSTEYVDKLVASFWSKVDQKIETAVSQYQSSPQGGQQTNTQDNAQAKTEDKHSGETNLGITIFLKIKLDNCPLFWIYFYFFVSYTTMKQPRSQGTRLTLSDFESRKSSYTNGNLKIIVQFC